MDNQTTENMKYCSFHKTYHSISEFEDDMRTKDGKKNICKAAYQEKYGRKKTTMTDPVEIIKKYFKEEHPDLFKVIQIKTIAKERTFMEVLVDSIEIEEEYWQIINQDKNREEVS